jgi:hypothetical protein
MSAISRRAEEIKETAKLFFFLIEKMFVTLPLFSIHVGTYIHTYMLGGSKYMYELKKVKQFDFLLESEPK